jgi:hypothetical protein
VKMLDPLLKNEYSKRVYQVLGLRKPFAVQANTAHYRMPVLREAGYRVLTRYSGTEIAASEWTSLEYMTAPTDPDTYFAPLASATGENMVRGFWDFGKPDLDGIWTPNARLAPTLMRYVESVGARYGRVQIIRQEPNSMRETRWGLHLDDNNRLNPEANGWVVRLWLQLTDNPDSFLVLRRAPFDKANEVRIPLPRYTQVLIDSERLFHGGYHGGPSTRYALITSFESGEQLEEWVASQLAPT